MTKDEAKQVLETLQHITADSDGMIFVDARPAIAIMRREVAAPDQEPVAWGMKRGNGLIIDVICPDEHDRYEGEYTVPLYAAPTGATE